MRSFPASTRCLLPALATALVAAALGTNAATADPGHPIPHAQRFDTPLGYVQGTRIPQTSDGIIGEIAPTVPVGRATEDQTIIRGKWQVAPGVHATVWNQPDARGPVREYLLAINYLQAGVHIDTMNDGAVRNTDTVLHMVKDAHAVAGVNGDFFDIGDTGAPIGIDRNSKRGLLNGRLSGWNSTFYITKQGRPMIDRLQVHTTIKQQPGIVFTNLNSPAVQPDGVGLYTHAWGNRIGYRITDGVTQHVRMVLVQDGKVVRNSVHLPSSGPVDGKMIVGRGAGAAQLASLKHGTPVTLTSRLSGAPEIALTGNQYLVHDGVIAVTDDREMAPRTAIGIDRDTHEILLLVVDGRQGFSRGYTMVEMANEMIDLGADEALNFDGGGSSTMVARHAGSVRVINSPSDGFQRSVANGISVSFTKK